ncbi:MAG TPA: hypothetical protein EYP24_00540, partial [bacterium (Candidatus Stahlbacteria)]|nr:hypothetical protein [Candidatus Stahlbacteria bacterium]
MKLRKDLFARIFQIAANRGKISLVEINELLPDFISPDDIDYIITELKKKGIEIVDDESKGERKRASGPTTRKEEPIRAYFRELAKYSLLSREEEIDLAQRIETGYRMIERQLFTCPEMIDFLVGVGQEVEKTRRPFDQVSRFDLTPMSGGSSHWSERQKFLRRVKSIEKEKDRLVSLYKLAKRDGSSTIKNKIHDLKEKVL